ncbi:MAG: hypothetical protein ACT6FF_05495 [Methanosarcinaceae archaeon]
MKRELYISTDIEADGKIPGISSMLSFGSAAYTEKKRLLSTFSVNLMQLPDAHPDTNTMKWWKTHPNAWANCRKNLKDPSIAMKEYYDWLVRFKEKVVFVGYPVAYDFMWVYWYLIKFVGKSPFSHSALDIKTMAMTVLKKPYRDSTKRNMPKRWFDNIPHTHDALSDAIEQGALFCNIISELKGLKYV